MHHGLASGVAAANDEDILGSVAQRCLACPCAVVHSGDRQPVLTRQVKAAIVYTRRANICARNDLCPIFEVSGAFAGEELPTHSCAADQNLGAEATGLLSCALGQIRPADSVRKSEVIFNS